MNHTQRVLAIHDMCSFGRCSLTAALPVISSMGFQVCPFPTALFSNNLTYGDFECSDFTPNMTSFMDKWQHLGLTFDAIYSGFLANAGQIGIVLDAISRFAKDDSLVVVDPAMADDGKLYPVFTPDIVTEMKKLIASATVVTPNYTEACLLTDTPYSSAIPTESELKERCQKLAALGPEKIVITSVPSSEDTIQVLNYDRASQEFHKTIINRIPFSTCGTGDLFTSVLTGSLLQGHPLSKGVEKAATFLSYAIDYTYKAGTDYREGVQVEPCLKHLVTME